MTPTIDVRINRLFNNKEHNLRAIASITICNTIAIHQIKIVDSENGAFVVMPSYSFENKEGIKRYREYAHPVSKEARELIHSEILKAYNNAILEAEGGSTDNEK